jgi:hypothetical protein
MAEMDTLNQTPAGRQETAQCGSDDRPSFVKPLTTHPTPARHRLYW